MNLNYTLFETLSMINLKKILFEKLKKSLSSDVISFRLTAFFRHWVSVEYLKRNNTKVLFMAM